MTTIKLTKTTIEKLPFSKSGQVFYRDEALTGFGVRVGTQSKAYYAEKRVKGKTVRITIGTHGQITTEQARKEAQKLLGIMTEGRNPVEEKQQAKIKGVTLQEVYDDYLKARKNLRPSTLYGYAKFMRKSFSDWVDKPLAKITKNMILNRHVELEKESGAAQANMAMRFLRAIFYFAIGRYEDNEGGSIIVENPVKVLSTTNAWYRVKKRTGVVKFHDLAAMFEGIRLLRETATSKKDEIAADYIVFILLTGMRRTEGTTIKWDQVDLKDKSLMIGETKNHEPLHLPLSEYLVEILQRRQAERINDYVFPGDGVEGCLIEPRAQIQRVRNLSGIFFTLHDLRRTFVTIAESLDISAYAVKRLVNHKLGGDVTDGYIIQNVERLRKPMQQITDYILERAGVGEK